MASGMRQLAGTVVSGHMRAGDLLMTDHWRLPTINHTPL